MERNFTFWNYSYFDKYIITIFQENVLFYFSVLCDWRRTYLWESCSFIQCRQAEQESILRTPGLVVT